MTCQDERVAREHDHRFDVRAVRIVGDARRQILCRPCREHYAAVWSFDFVAVDAPEPWSPPWRRHLRAKDMGAWDRAA